MEKPGMTVSRWIDGVLEKNELIDQDINLRAMVFWGHAPNSQTRGKEMLEAMKKLDTLVIIDPYPSATAAMAAMVRKDGVYLLPACTQFETSGSVTASNRSLQWREKVIEPLFESQARPHDHAGVREEVRLRRGVRGKQTDKLVKTGRQGQGRLGRAGTGVDAARDQPRHVDDRLHRAVARAPEAAHEEHGDLRREDAARQGRTVRRRLLRPAVAVLRQRRRSSIRARRTCTTVACR